MKKLFLLLLPFFLAHCGEDSKSREAYKSDIQISTWTGTYTGSNEGTDYELWIGDTGDNNKLAVLLFEKQNSSAVKKTLGRLQNLQSYFAAVCEHTQAREYTYKPEFSALNKLWNGIGAVGYTEVNSERNIMGYSITTINHMLQGADEYSLQSIRLLDHKGKTLQVGFVKTTSTLDRITRHFSTNVIKMERKSSSVSSSLKTYYKNQFAIRKSFGLARQKTKPYCETLLTE